VRVIFDRRTKEKVIDVLAVRPRGRAYRWEPRISSSVHDGFSTS